MKYCKIIFCLIFLSLSIKAENNEIYRKLVHIENIVRQQEIRIQTLEGTVKEQQQEIARLNNVIDNREQKVYTDSSNASRVVEAERNEDILSRHETKEEKKTDGMERGSRLLTGNVPVQSSAVAFYAYLGKNEILAMHHALIFDVVITNIGNGFNKNTGSFVAPQSGVYVLTSTIFPNRGALTAVNIRRNNEVVGQIFGDMVTANGEILSGSTGVVVVTMNIGDTASVVTSSIHPSTGFLLSDANIKTSFAGWKIADL